MRSTFRTLIAAGATAALVAAPSAAFAGERPDHAGRPDRAGPSSTDDEREWTEDDDTNDGTPNNVVDDHDDAHPSGRDRSVEHGGSGNQGRAQADPDDDARGPDRTNAGADQPDGPGGIDQADQDGNNGCGNDDDFEDDNEGWCGRPPEDDVEEGDTATASVPTTSPQRDVLGTDVTPAPATSPAAADARDAADPASVSSSAPAVSAIETEVLGVVLARPAAPTSVLAAPAGGVLAAGAGVLSAAAPAAPTASGTLPRSGTDVVPAALAGALALVGGVVAIRRTRAA